MASTTTAASWKEKDRSLLHNVYHKDKMPPSQPDYIIVGSGIGGLWLGACLAKFNITEEELLGGMHSTTTGKMDDRYVQFMKHMVR